MTKVTFNDDGTQTHDTEGSITVNPAHYRKVFKLVQERHQILTGQIDLGTETDKNSFTWMEIRIRLPEVEADILAAVHALVLESEIERRLGFHDPRFEPQHSVEAIHKQAERLKEVPPCVHPLPTK